MRGRAGFFDIDERLKELSAKGDTLERLNTIGAFELFRPDLAFAVGHVVGASSRAITATFATEVSDPCTKTRGVVYGSALYLVDHMRRPSSRSSRPKRETRSASGEVEADVAGSEDITDRICATLATAIAERAFRPGTKILEDAIADHFGVSRTVVRGALGVLQRDRLLERKRNHGTFVAEPSIAEANDLFQARRALESIILGQVVERATPADLDRLEDIVAAEQRVHDDTNEAAKKRLSGRFHVELARLGKNEVMTELLAKVVSRISLVMALYEHQAHDDCGTDHHRAIIADLRRRDLVAAQARMSEHLDDIEGRVRLTPAQGDRHTFVSVLKAFTPA